MTEPNTSETVRLRLTPALIIAALQIAIFLAFHQFGATIIQSAIGNFGVPLLGTIAFLVWWMFKSGAPKRDRIAGLALFLVGVAVVILTQDNTYNGTALLGGALLYLVPGLALLFLLTAAFPWPARRGITALFLIACMLTFAAMKVTGVGEGFTTYTDWRWKAATQAGIKADSANATAVLPAQVTAGDWPAFRGPERDSARPRGVTCSTDWSTPPKEVWRRAVGPGHSSFCIVGEVLFTQEQSGEDELVTCYSALTGEPIWVNSIKYHHNDVQGGEGPRATPAYANGKLYTQSAGSILQCLDAATGKLLWKQDLSTKENPNPPIWGFSSSPLVVGDLVIQHSTGAGRRDMAAFNAATGAEVWSAAKDSAGYSSPHLTTVDGQPQVLMLDSSGLQSVDPLSGATLWTHEWPRDMLERCVQPVPTENGGIALGTTDQGTRLLQLKKTDTGWDVKQAWDNTKHRPYFYDNVYHKGFIYGFDGNRLCCLDATTGETKWQGTRFGGQVMLLPEVDALVVLSEKGKVALVKADPAAFTELSQFAAIHGRTWNHPAIAHGKLYVRNSEEMACYELPGI